MKKLVRAGIVASFLSCDDRLLGDLQAEFAEDATAIAELRAELAIWCRLHHVRRLVCLPPI